MRRTCLTVTLVLSAIHPVAGNGDVRLIEAVKAEDRAAVRAFLREKRDVNARQPDGATALHWAASLDDVETVGLLLGAGADVDAANDYGITALSLAATNGSAAVIEKLLKAGANPNTAKASGETALMTAARTGKMAAVNVLIRHGADVNTKESTHGQDALMWALSQGHLEAARALVERGAEVEGRSASGFSPLMFAARQGDVEAGRMLLGRGADVNAAASDGTTALHVAVVRGHVAFAEFLLREGADPNADRAGYTALHWAVGKWETISTHRVSWSETTESREWRAMDGVPERKLDLVKALLGHGANVNALITQDPPRWGEYSSQGRGKRLEGATPFLLAAMSADLDMMRFLLANGADPALMTKAQVTPLMVAAGAQAPGAAGTTFTAITASMAIGAIQLALEVGNDVNMSDARGETALHHAIDRNLPDVVRFLVDNGAQVNVKNKRGLTPLRYAMGFAQDGQTGIVPERPEVAAVLRQLGATE